MPEGYQPRTDICGLHGRTFGTYTADRTDHRACRHRTPLIPRQLHDLRAQAVVRCAAFGLVGLFADVTPELLRLDRTLR
jgi:hypothetical protein